MGMFDEVKAFSEHFTEGEPFDLEAARLGPAIKTDYGTDKPAQLKIGGEWYSAFGQGLVNQIGRMEDGDLPARVRMIRAKTNSGQEVKILEPTA